jgi:phosphoenolpyruvate-protein kinase (PTS system EI component)
MIEVPSACLDARRILTEAAFASIGTNDLIQYLFAIDRNNERVAADYNADRPVFWTVIETLVKAARDTGRPLSVCGEIAGNPVHLERLMSLGIRTVSVGARSISRVRSCAGRFCARTGNM